MDQGQVSVSVSSGRRALTRFASEWTAPDCLEASCGKIANEVERIRRVIHRPARLNPCDPYRVEIEAANAVGDMESAQKINTAQNYFKCRGHRRSEAGFGPFRLACKLSVMSAATNRVERKPAMPDLLSRPSASEEKRPMKWYSAHNIMYFELKVTEPAECNKSEEEREFVIWENVILFLGDSVDEVRDKAKKRGKEDERHGGDDLKWDDRPVKMVFGGVRKIVECDYSVDERALNDGDEATYSEMKIKGRDRLSKLIHGEKVDVHLEN